MSAAPITDGLRELLGPNAVLLSWPRGSKGTTMKWGHLTIGDMTHEHLARCQTATSISGMPSPSV